MDASRRVQRVEKEIQHLVASFFLTEGRGRLPGFISVAEVSVSPDLRHAKVFLSYIGDSADRDAVVETVEELRPEAQHRVSKTLTMKFSPRLRFYVSRGPGFAIET